MVIEELFTAVVCVREKVSKYVGEIYIKERTHTHIYTQRNKIKILNNCGKRYFNKI